MENLSKIGLSYILKEPQKWRNALIVDTLTRVGRISDVEKSVKQPVIEAAIAYLQTFKGIVLHPSLRGILEVWPRELERLQKAFYNLSEEDADGPEGSEEAPGAAEGGYFNFTPGFFAG